MKKMKLIISILLLIILLCLIAYIPRCIRVIERDVENNKKQFVEAIEQISEPYYAFLNSITVLCEDTQEDKNTFIQKLRDLLKEKETWQERNKDIAQEHSEVTMVPVITKVFDNILMDAIYNLRRSLETDTNPITRDKKTTAIALISEKIDPRELDKYMQERMKQEDKQKD